MGFVCIRKGEYIYISQDKTRQYFIWGLIPPGTSTVFQMIFRSCLHVASHAGVFRRARFSSLPTNACSTKNNIVWFQKISIPSPRMVLPIRPPHPLGISVPEGSCITPHSPGISCFPFHGLNLPYLEIINRLPLRINCSHLETHFFYNL